MEVAFVLILLCSINVKFEWVRCLCFIIKEIEGTTYVMIAGLSIEKLRDRLSLFQIHLK